MLPSSAELSNAVSWPVDTALRPRRLNLHDFLCRAIGRILFYKNPHFLTCKLINFMGMTHLNFYKSGVFDSAYSYNWEYRAYIWWMNDSVMSITLQRPVATLYRTRFNRHGMAVIPTEGIYVLCIDVRRNSDYFSVQHWLISWCNWARVWAETWNGILVIDSLLRVSSSGGKPPKNSPKLNLFPRTFLCSRVSFLFPCY